MIFLRFLTSAVYFGILNLFLLFFLLLPELLLYLIPLKGFHYKDCFFRNTNFPLMVTFNHPGTPVIVQWGREKSVLGSRDGDHV